MGRPRKGQEVDAATKRRIVSLHQKQGLSFQVLAKRFGVNSITIGQYVAESQDVASREELLRVRPAEE